MFWELIGAVMLAFGAGGVAMGLRWASGKRLPKWITPAAAGLGMISYGIWMDYSWAERTEAALPQGVTAVREARDGAFWRPWTLAAPPVVRFAAVDRGFLRSETAPQMRITSMYFFERHMPPGETMVLVDCSDGRMAPIPAGAAEFDAAGVPQVEIWEDLTEGDPILAALCAS